MTARDWLVTATSVEDVARLESGSPRKQRLLATAWLRRVVQHWSGFGKVYRDGLDANERYADSREKAELATLAEQLRAEQRELDRWHHDEFPYHYTTICRGMRLATGLGRVNPVEVLVCVRDAIHSIHKRPEWEAEERTLADLLRDIFGTPVPPVSFDPAWRTETAVTLAKQMYESRDFGAIPILADALQDAGCTSDDILDHCRGPGPHVRGCWVVDLVLGKE
jgi:hypothetical protein